MSWFSDTLEDVDAWLGGGDDSGGGTNWDIDSAAIDYSVDEERQNFMNMGEFADMGHNPDPTGYSPDDVVGSDGGAFPAEQWFFEPMEDERSYAKRWKDSLFSAAKELGVSRKVLEALGDFAGAAFPKGGTRQGDGSRSSELAQKRSPRGSGSQGRPISGPGRTVAAKLIAASKHAQRAAAALSKGVDAEGNTSVTANQLLAAVTGETATRSKTIPLSDTLRQMPNLQPPRTIA